jgi:predicted RNase H-like nuclease (RuvC/YqgF family)
MLNNLFGKDKDKEKEEEEKRQMAEGMQSMSDQILALSNQMTEKNAELERLQKAAKDATSGSAAGAKALQAAQQQVADLQKQLRELQRKAAEDKAKQEADAMAADLIRKQQAKQQSAAPTAKVTSAQPASSTAAPTSGGIAIGGTAYVTSAGGMPLRLRSGAGLNHESIDRLPPGTQMTLLDGPRQSDNHAWWRIRTTDGREGWVAGEELRTQPD